MIFWPFGLVLGGLGVDVKAPSVSTALFGQCRERLGSEEATLDWDVDDATTLTREATEVLLRLHVSSAGPQGHGHKPPEAGAFFGADATVRCPFVEAKHSQLSGR